MIGGMVIAVEPAPAGGELTAARALGRLRRAAPGAVNTALAAIALVGAGIVVAFNGGTDAQPHELLALVGLGLAISTCAALGALIVAGRPRHRLGLALLIGGAVSAVWLFVTAWADVPAGSDRPLVQWAAWLDNWIFVGLIVLVTWPMLLFPDGALPSRRWRPIGALLFVATAAVGVAGMLDPGTLSSVDEVQNPLGIPESWTWVTLLEGFGIVIPMGVVAGMLAVQRQARARPGPGMRAALWASRALAANFVLVLALDPEGPVYAATLTASIALFAAAATVAVLRDRVIEIDIVLRRAFIVAGVAASCWIRRSRRSRRSPSRPRRNCVNSRTPSTWRSSRERTRDPGRMNWWTPASWATPVARPRAARRPAPWPCSIASASGTGSPAPWPPASSWPSPTRCGSR
jgi:hypothetical protein